MDRLSAAIQPDDGQALIEYALILAFVVVAVVGTLALISPPVVAFFQDAVDSFP